MPSINKNNRIDSVYLEKDNGAMIKLYDSPMTGTT